MSKYFGQVNFVIEADDENSATETQEQVRQSVQNMPSIVYANADEPVEHDEFGHAG